MPEGLRGAVRWAGTNKCLDVAERPCRRWRRRRGCVRGGGRGLGSNIQLMDCNEQQNQLFSVDSCAEPPSTLTPTTTVTATATSTLNPPTTVTATTTAERCIKQGRGWYCIPCSVFTGPCKRDATVLSAMIFPPTQHCGEGGACGRYFRSIRVLGRFYRRPPQTCRIYNDGAWLADSTTAGYCICDPIMEYSYRTMRVRGGKDVYRQAFQYSIETSAASFSCSREIFCYGRGEATGEIGQCTCACDDGFSGDRCEHVEGA